MNYIEVGLKKGRYTGFVIARDQKGKLIAIPSGNLKIAFREGTKETLEQLKKLGLKEPEEGSP